GIDWTPPVGGEVLVASGRNPDGSPAFRIRGVPPASRNDAATGGKWTIVDGERDANSGGLEKLSDGKLPTEDDQPSENFFFNAGTDGGRLQLDLGRVVGVKEINTYSWHPDTRAAQVYTVYASDGSAADFNPAPKRGTAPGSCGWKKLTAVDTRPRQ